MSDEVPSAFNNMHGFSTVDGFVEVTECMAEMIKYVANEPSVGLFYVQQHAQNAVPNLINRKNNVVEKSREMTLHSEDLEDSISMVRSMKECGFPIADDMIRDIRKSLGVMSTKQPKRGLIHSTSSGFQIGRTSSWGPATWGLTAVSTHQDNERTGGYLSTVFKTAKQRASNFKWPQFDSKEFRDAKGENLLSYPPSELEATPSTTSTLRDTEVEELPVSSQIADELQEEEPIDEDLSSHPLLSLSETFDEFRADREAKLEDWLGGNGNRDGLVGGTNAG